MNRCATCGTVIIYNPEFKVWLHRITTSNERYDHKATKVVRP